MKTKITKKRIAIFTGRHMEVSNDTNRNFQLIGKRWNNGDVVYDENTIKRLRKLNAPIEIYFKEIEEQVPEDNADRSTEGGHP